MTHHEFVKKNISGYQIFCIKNIPFYILDLYGRLIPKEQINRNLSDNGYVIVDNKPIIVHGSVAGWFAILLIHLGYSNVSIVIGDTFRNESHSGSLSFHDGSNNKNSSLNSKSLMESSRFYYKTTPLDDKKIEEGRSGHICYCAIM